MVIIVTPNKTFRTALSSWIVQAGGFSHKSSMAAALQDTPFLKGIFVIHAMVWLKLDTTGCFS